MGDERIEREIVIEAPPSVVWRVVTEPDQITRWFADHVTLEAVPGGRGSLVFDHPDRASSTFEVVVERVEPPRLFSFRWVHPEGETPAPGNSLLVEFTLTPIGDERTLLRVVESGLGLLGVVRGREGALPRGPPLGLGHPPRAAGAVDVGRTRILTDGVSPETGDEVWSAIADPSRRRVLDLLVHNSDVTASWLAGRVPFSRQAVTKHLAVLERAGLVSRHQHGREVQYRVRAGPPRRGNPRHGAGGEGLGRPAGGHQTAGRVGSRGRRRAPLRRGSPTPVRCAAERACCPIR